MRGVVARHDWVRLVSQKEGQAKMNRCPVSVFAAPYRPRKSTAASARVCGHGASFCLHVLGAIAFLAAIYFVGAIW